MLAFDKSGSFNSNGKRKKKMKIIVLMEDASENKDYLCEHGLSVYVETA